MKNLKRRLRIGGVAAGLAALLKFVDCAPIGLTPTVPNDLLKGQTISLYEEDLKVEYNNKVPYNLFHGAPAIQAGAAALIFPSRDFDNAVVNAPFGVAIEGRENPQNIPFVYIEYDLVFRDTDFNYFTNGASYSIFLPTANNFIMNGDFLTVTYNHGHSPDYLTQNPHEGPLGPE